MESRRVDPSVGESFKGLETDRFKPVTNLLGAGSKEVLSIELADFQNRNLQIKTGEGIPAWSGVF